MIATPSNQYASALWESVASISKKNNLNLRAKLLSLTSSRPISYDSVLPMTFSASSCNDFQPLKMYPPLTVVGLTLTEGETKTESMAGLYYSWIAFTSEVSSSSRRPIYNIIRTVQLLQWVVFSSNGEISIIFRHSFFLRERWTTGRSGLTLLFLSAIALGIQNARRLCKIFPIDIQSIPQTDSKIESERERHFVRFSQWIRLIEDS